MATATMFATSFSWPASRLRDFESGPEDVLVVERPVLDGVEAAVANARVGEYRGGATSRTAARVAQAAVSALAMELPALAADIEQLAKGFLDHFGVRQVQLRFGVFNTQSCPKFHCDNVKLRLITTYVGLGTQYRAVDSEAIHTAPPAGLVFLKGHLHPTHSDTTLHRSPPMPAGARRLCLVID